MNGLLITDSESFKAVDSFINETPLLLADTPVLLRISLELLLFLCKI